MKARGKAHKFGNDIDTDVIIPGRYLNTTDPEELAGHCMEGADPDFPNKVRPGDVMVGGKNFGSGSSREHAPIAIKATGIAVVIANSYARIFYRNAFNTGLPLLECAEAAAAARPGDEIEVELESGTIYNRTLGRKYQAAAVPEFMLKLIKDGGLIEHLKNQPRRKK